MKRISVLLCVVTLLGSLCGCGKTTGVTVYDADGNVMGTPTAMKVDAATLTDPAYSSYIDVVLSEAANALASAAGLSAEQVQQRLFTGGYHIYTAFDPAVCTALQEGYRDRATKDLEYAAAVTDHSGRLLATYSVGEQNFAITRQSPHSSFKPLGVYAPALDAGLIDWSTQITDRPYSQIKGDDGTMQDWPKNASGTYSYVKTNLYECIRQSLNTASVHCLSRLGVDKSIAFLQDSFGIDLTYEQTMLQQKGADEIIGNIALGSTRAGVTPVDMAGYYQIFGNGGQYTAPYTILEIRDEAGQTVYTAAAESKQVLKPTTAYIMNQLLRGVVQGGGTGDQAGGRSVPVAGKTGTGNRGEGNWFVGVTPQYSMAVYHGDCPDRNIADILYGAVLDHLPTHTVTDFPACPAVRKGVFCVESGKLFSAAGCSRMYVGYYDPSQTIPVCDAH